MGRKLFPVLLTLIILKSYLAKVDHRDLGVISPADVFEIDFALVMDSLLRLLQRETVGLCTRARLICQVACILGTPPPCVQFSLCSWLHDDVGISEGLGLLSLIWSWLDIEERLGFADTFEHLLGG